MVSATPPVRTRRVSPSRPRRESHWWVTWPAPRTGSPSRAPPLARQAAAGRPPAVSRRTALRGFVGRSSAPSPTTRGTSQSPPTATSTASSGPSLSGSTWTRTRWETGLHPPTEASASDTSSSRASVDFITPILCVRKLSHFSPLSLSTYRKYIS